MKNMFKKLFSALLIFTMSSCNIEFETHTHTWSKYYDNGDGTHTRTCIYDIDHVETKKHDFNDGLLIEEPTIDCCGKLKVTCIHCGYSKIKSIYPEGDHTFDRKIVADKYLYKQTSDYSGLYYLSCACGAYGDVDKVFEYNSISSEYSVVDYIKSNGSQYVDIGLSNNVLYYNGSTSSQNSSLLPTGYTQLEYIEATGTQKIDTGIKFDMENGKIECEFQSNVENQNGMIIATPQTSNYFWFYHYIDGKCIALYNGCSSKIICVGKTNINLEKHTMTYENKSIYIDDELLGKDSRTLSTTDTNLFIFSWNQDEYHSYKGKLFSCKIYNSKNSLARNYIPCKRNSDSEIGLYDLVSNAFFENFGTGELVGGPEVINSNDLNIPREYSQIEYIEATGTQYIDSGIIGPAKWVFDIQYTTNLTKRQLMGHGGSAGEYWGVTDGYYGKATWAMSNIAIGNRDIVQINNFPKNCDAGTSGYVYVNGVYAYNNHYDAKSANSSAKIFSINGNFKSYCKLWSCKVYDTNNVLIRDYIPVISNYSGEIGLYDLVGDEFYGSISGNPFELNDAKIYNNNSKIIQATSSYTKVEYIESTGKEYIDTNYYVDYSKGFRVEVEFEPTDIDCRYCMLSNFSTNNDLSLEISPDNHARIWFDKGENDLRVGNVIQDKNTLIYSLDGNVISINFNGDTSSETVVLPASNPNLSMLIFMDQAKRLEQFDEGMKIYSFKIYSGDNLDRDYIPVKDNLTGKIGLFDKVENKFYGSDSSYDFSLCGKEEYQLSNSIPGYSRVEYIESTGTQYINTLVAVTPTIESVIDWDISSFTNGVNDWTCLYGYSNSSTGYPYSIWGKISNQQMRFYRNNDSIVVDYVPGRSQMTFTSNSTTTEGSIYIFSNGPDCEIWSNTICPYKLYGLKIYDDGILIRDYVPVISNTTSEAGLYDLVENKFYGNDGTGDFLTGTVYFEDTIHYDPINNDTVSKTISSKYQEVSSVTLTKSNMLDTSLTINNNSTVEMKFTLHELNNYYLFGTNKDFNVKIIDNKVVVYYNNNYYESSTVLELNKIYTVVVGNKLESENNNNYIYFTFDNFNIDDYTLYIFNDEEASNINGTLTLYKVNVYTNKNLSDSFIPSYEIKTNNVGLYNVNKKHFNEFIYKQEIGTIDNTSSYTLKDENVVLPEGYTRIDSIHGDGSQYLDTLVKYDSSIKQTIKIEASFDDASIDGQYFGYTLEAGAYIGISTNKRLGLFESSSAIKNNYVYGFELSFENNYGTVTYNNNSQTFELDSDYENATFTLFTASSVKEDPSTYFKGRIYSLRVYEYDCLVNLFIPSINSNNEVGLYDFVNDRFIISATESRFIKETSIFNGLNEDNINLFYEFHDTNYFLNKSKFSTLNVTDSSGNIVRQFVSVIRNSDSKPGIYDVLNDVFYYSLYGDDFEYGEIVGHSFDDGVLIKQASKNEDGIIEYTCKECGLKHYEIIDRLSYEVKFENNTNSLIYIYNSFDLFDFEITNIAYSRNINTCNYSKSNAVVLFRLDNDNIEISISNGEIVEYEQNVYMIKNMTEDTTVIINVK